MSGVSNTGSGYGIGMPITNVSESNIAGTPELAGDDSALGAK